MDYILHKKPPNLQRWIFYSRLKPLSIISHVELGGRAGFLINNLKNKWFFMILTREISIKITESNMQYYEDLGYDVSIGENLLIPVELMSRGSHYKIKCKCDSCSIEKDVIFKNYVKYDNDWGQYYCRKCSEKKRKDTLQRNYGVDYPIQNKKVMSKMKKTLMKKYGVDNISKRDIKQNNSPE